MQSINVEQIEERTYRTLFDDGLMDMLLGAFVVAFGLVMTTGLGYGPILLSAACMPLWLAGRKLITEPRLGTVKLHADRAKRLQLALRSLSLVLVATSLLGAGLFLAWESGWQRQLLALGPVPLGLTLAAAVAAAGYLFGVSRWYAHAAVIAVGFAGVHLAGGPGGSGTLAAGAVIATWGAMLLVRFLRRHPRLPGVGAHGS